MKIPFLMKKKEEKKKMKRVLSEEELEAMSLDELIARKEALKAKKEKKSVEQSSETDNRIQQFRSEEERVAAEVVKKKENVEEKPVEDEKRKVWVVSFPVSEKMKADIEAEVERLGFLGADGLAQEAMRRFLGYYRKQKNG